MTLTNNYTWQLGDLGVVLNDDSIPNQPFIDILKVTGYDSAPFRQTKREHEGVDGGFMDAEYETGRDIVFEGMIYFNGNSIQGFLDNLKANWGPSTSLIPLYFLANEVGLRTLYVKPLGCNYDLETAIRIGMTPVKFSAYAEDPRLYSSALQTFTVPIGATTTTGFGFNLGFNFGFGGSSSTTDGQFVFVDGNRPTPVILTITGPVTNPSILNDTLSKTLGYTIVLSSADTLTTDTQYRTVRLNGTANRRSALTLPGWFMLQPGYNFIRFRADAGTGSLTGQFRAAWR